MNITCVACTHEKRSRWRSSRLDRRNNLIGKQRPPTHKRTIARMAVIITLPHKLHGKKFKAVKESRDDRQSQSTVRTTYIHIVHATAFDGATKAYIHCTCTTVIVNNSERRRIYHGKANFLHYSTFCKTLLTAQCSSSRHGMLHTEGLIAMNHKTWIHTI